MDIHKWYIGFQEVLQRFRILSAEFVSLVKQSRIVWKCKTEITFCYVGYMLSSDGGCEHAVSVNIIKAWNKFREL